MITHHRFERATGDVERQPASRPSAGRVWLAVAGSVAVVALLVGVIALVARGRDGAAPEAGLVGHAWVVVDHAQSNDLPMLRFEATAQPYTFSLLGSDDCNAMSGSLSVDDGVVVRSLITSSLIACSVEGAPVAQLVEGASVAIDDGTLTVTFRSVTTRYRALDSLTPAALADLQGEWVIGDQRLRVTSDGSIELLGDQGQLASIRDALLSPDLAAWLSGDSVIVRIWDDGGPGRYVRLD